MSDRLDESKLDQLRAWGTGLGAHESPDVRATGKAILMLIEEIERLHVDLWSARSTEASLPASTEPARDQTLEAALAEQANANVLGRALRDRLSRNRK